ncbi:MAG: ATPase [Planctomycetes bacterium]|nr:ATPase [Planctomycetota bacterium]
MKIAIPITHGRACLRLDDCEQVALIEIGGADKTVIGPSYLTTPPRELDTVPHWLRNQGASVIIVGSVNPRMRDLFSRNGIGLVVSGRAESVKDLVSAYLAGTLEAGHVRG